MELSAAAPAVGARPRLGAVDEVQALDRGAEQPRDQPQPGVLRAQVEQSLLGVEPEVDGRRHRVRAHLGELVGLGLAVGGALDEIAVGLVRGRRKARGRPPRRGRRRTRRRPPDRRGGLGARAPGTAACPRASRFMRPSSICSSTCSISHAQPISRSPSSASHRIPNSRSSSDALVHHRLVALLEDVQRDQLVGERDEPEREQREFADDPSGISKSSLGAGCPVAAGGPLPLTGGQQQVVEDRRRQQRLEHALVEPLQHQVAAERVAGATASARRRARRWPRARG